MSNLPLIRACLVFLCLSGPVAAKDDLLFGSGFETGAATIGPAGGLVPGPDNVRLIVPPGAVPTPVSFRIAADGAGAPPLPEAVAAAGAVYAITPHGTAFGATAVVELPVPAGNGPAFLLKADPGGVWAKVADVATGAASVRAGIGSLSYLAVARCALGPGEARCPANHRLTLELLDGSGIPVPIDQSTWQPVRLITTPETLTLRLRWERPALVIPARTDTLFTGDANTGGVLQRSAGFQYDASAPDALLVSATTERTFNITVTPSQVAGAGGPNGRVVRLWGQSKFRVPVPFGNEDWAFEAFIPILVRTPGTTPIIVTPPASVTVDVGNPATFSVVAQIDPPQPLDYQWRRRAPGAGNAFVPVQGANAASLTVPAVQPGDDGAQFDVVVCDAGTTRCVTSAAATLSVRATAPVFTVEPQDTTVPPGTVVVGAAASGNPPPSIAWERAPAIDPSNFQPINNVPGCAPTPAGSAAPTTASCTLTVTGADDGMRVRAVATNVASPMGVRSRGARIGLSGSLVAPSFTREPADALAFEGDAATFRVEVAGAPFPSVSWSANGVPLPVADGPFAVGLCTGTLRYEAANRRLSVSDLDGNCSGLELRASADNGVGPPVDSASATLTVVPLPAVGVTLLAGSPAGDGFADGSGDAASFAGPRGIATDAAGNAYVTDTRNFTIRRITPDRAVTTFAGAAGQGRGTESGDGIGGNARFGPPEAIAIDPNRNVAYVGDECMIRRIDLATAAVTTIVGNPDASTCAVVDGVGTAARLRYPTGIAVAPDGTVWFTESSHTVRRIIVGAGANPTYVVQTFAGQPDVAGSVDGVGSAARFRSPSGIAVAPDGTMYVTDTDNHTIRRITPAAGVTTIAGAPGQDIPSDGVGTAARFRNPVGPVLVGGDALYLADRSSNAIRRIDLATLQVTTPAGDLTPREAGSANGIGTAAFFDRPWSLAFAAPQSRLLIIDSGNDAVRAMPLAGAPLTGDTVISFAGQVGAYGYADGLGIAARFDRPFDVAWDGAGSVYVTDSANHVVRRVRLDGLVSTVAGGPREPGADDGVGADARFRLPRGITVAPDGRVWMTDRSFRVRRFDPADGSVVSIAGAALELGTSDGIGAAARFRLGWGMAADGNGDIYLAETGTDGSTPGGSIRRITPAGMVSTTTAALGNPLDVAVGPLASLVVADSAVGADSLLRSVSPAGQITELAGGGACCALDGPALQASFADLKAVLLDGGDVLAIDAGMLIRRLSGGTVSTPVGAPFPGLPGIRLGPGGRPWAAKGFDRIAPGLYVVAAENAILLVRLP